MSNVSKHGNSYRVRWFDSHGNRRSKSGFPTKREALAYAADRDREQRLGLAGEGYTFEQVAEEMLDTHHASEAQISKLRSMLKHVTFGGLPVRSVTPSIIVRWRAGLPTDHIRYSATAAVKQVLLYAERMRYLERSPAAQVQNPQPKSPDVRPFADWVQVERLDVLLGGVATLAVGTGLRPQEWSRLRWEHVDLAGRAIILPASIAKNGVARRIPLRERAIASLSLTEASEGMVFDVPDLRGWRRKVWAPALEACGLEYRRPYEMRHTYATWALRAGVSTFLVARRMGTSVAMIDKTYGQYAVDTEAHELRLLDAFDGPVVGQIEAPHTYQRHTTA